MEKLEGSVAQPGYDWNVLSKYYLIKGAMEAKELPKFCHHIEWSEDKPTKEEDVQKFITENNLNHGDLVNFGDYRQTQVVIVSRDIDGKMSWIQNPDDHSAGYMTIPAGILHNVTDCVEKYREVMDYMSDNNQPFNMHVSPKDLLIKDKFGDVPQEWAFDFFFIAPDDIESLFAKHPDAKESKEFNWYDVSWESITDYFTAKLEGGEEAKFNVRAMLKGELMEKFKTKHTKKGGSKYSWRAARPKLPRGWQLEGGQSMGGPDKVGWIWKLNGPSAGEEEAKEKLKDFFGDIPFEKVDASEVNLKYD